jgi:hypothetical protein
VFSGSEHCFHYFISYVIIREHSQFLELPFVFPYPYAVSRQRDKDGDGKLTFEEYFHGLHDHIHGYDDEDTHISHIGNMTIAKERFSKLDKDSDG